MPTASPSFSRSIALKEALLHLVMAQVMAIVGFGELQDSEKCLVAVALGGWHSGAGYFAPRPPIQFTGSESEAVEDGNASDESVELVGVSTEEERAKAAQEQAIDLSQDQQSGPEQVESTPRGLSDEDEEQGRDGGSASSFGSAQRRDFNAGPSAAGTRPVVQRNVRRSPAATPASSPKRSRSEAFEASGTQAAAAAAATAAAAAAAADTGTMASSDSDSLAAANAMHLDHKLQCARLHVVGHFGERTKYGRGVRAPKAGDRLHARRDRDNEFDKNAVAILRDAKEDPSGPLVGFLPREVSKLLARYFDRGELRVDDIRVTNRGLEGAKIDVFLRMSTASEELQEQLDFQLGRAIELSGY